MQTAKIMVAFKVICEKEKPDLVMVVGDVNSTLACSIVAKKLLIKVAHVEAGRRSFDLTMSEEINRMVADAISDYFFVTEESGSVNLLREGKPTGRCIRAGILRAYREALEKAKHATVPPLWDGTVAERIWDVISRETGIQ